MTISTAVNKTIALGNNSDYTFAFNFIYDLSSYISVLYTDENGVATLLSPSQYTLFLNPAAVGSLWGVGGTVTYPLTGDPLDNGTSLTIQRILPLTQTISISNQGSFYPTVVERELDTLCMQIQQVSARTGQERGTWTTNTIYNYGDIVQDGVNGANTQNYYICVIPNTSSTWTTDLAAGYWSLSIDVQTINDYANSAADSAADAAASAVTAASQAASASTSAGNAATSESNASTSAATATTQAGIASSAASSALASQVAAASSASSASTSAATATTQASNASTSATNASSSASSASSSAAAASVSAAAAAASAILAGSTLTATSTTSNTIGTGNFTFTTQANKNFFAGQPIQAASAANGANYINGFVFSYSGTTLVITETNNGGSGAHSDWNISVSGTQGVSGTGSGTVTSVSVTTANGVSGSVATATSTPAITLALGSITPTSVAASGLVTGSNLSGTNTGDQTTVAGNAGTATALQTARAIYGNNFDGTAALTQVIASTYGGTGNGFSKLSGPTTSEKTFTLPNASATILTTNDLVTVAQGGTGLGTLTANNIILGNGTSTPQFVAPGTSGNLLTSNGTTWQSTAFVGSSTVIYNAQSSGYTLLAADNSKLVDFTGSSGATFAFTAAATLGSGWFCYIRNAGTANAELTLDPNSSEQIDGLTSYIMYPGECRLVQCTGSAFNTVVLKPFDTGIRTSTYTFTVPPGYTLFDGFIWGGGGSGGKGATNGGGGGGGGACVPFTASSTLIGSAGTTITVTIGAGGAGQTSANTAGNAGNTSTFGTYFNGYGGGSGGGASSGAGGGGGGSGYFNNNSVSAITSGVGGNAVTITAGIGGVSWDVKTGAAANGIGNIYNGAAGADSEGIGGSAYYGGGGGGGAGSSTPGDIHHGGRSVYGGGGGGGAGPSAGKPGSGGVSQFGGNGGAGAFDSNNATAGSAPGGGGGGSETGTSGAGGSGGCRIVGKV